MHKELITPTPDYHNTHTQPSAKTNITWLLILTIILLNACSHFPQSPPNQNIPPKITNTTNRITPTNASQITSSKQHTNIIINDFGWTQPNSTLGGEDSTLVQTAGDIISLSSIPNNAINIAVNADKPTFLTTAKNSNTIAWLDDSGNIQLWDAGEIRELHRELENTPITSLALSNSGDQIAIATSDNHLEIWEIRNNTKTHDIKLDSWVSHLTFSPDGNLISGVDPSNFKVHIMSIVTSQNLVTLSWTEHASPALYGAYFSNDWQKLAWVSRNSIQIMDVADGGSLGHLLSHEDFINTMAWSPDGKIIATSAAGTIEGVFVPMVIIWDTSTGEPLIQLAQKEPITQLSFSPDGTLLAMLRNSGLLEIWSLP